MANSIITVTLFVLIVVFLVTSMFLQSSTALHQPITAPPPFIHKHINKIHDGLYLTDFKNAKDYEALKRLGVRQILTIGKELPRHGEPIFKVMHIKADDVPTENLKKYFNSTYDFIKRGPTVVHCAMGISRSTTIVIAYLMRKYGMTFDEALKHVQDRRPCINPNPGFRDQLRQFEKEIKKPVEPDSEKETL